MNTPTVSCSWRLRHAWHSQSDLATLDLCARRLAEEGIAFAHAAPGDEPDALKLHGFELVEAVRRGDFAFADLRDVASTHAWESHVDRRAWQFMRHGDAVFGIPVAIHQSNVLWTNPSLGEAVGDRPDLMSWFESAAKLSRTPLAVGREPWQIGILFETLFAAQGEESYRRTLVDLEPEAFEAAPALAVLEQLRALRDRVDERQLDLPWRRSLELVDAGAPVAMLMGDWVFAAKQRNVRRVALVPTAPTVYVVDFFVPVAGAGDAGHARVAAALTDIDFQGVLAAEKGGAPAVVARPPALSVPTDRRSLPSFTFDQCCAMSIKQAILAIVAEHFLQRMPAGVTARRLAAQVAHASSRT